MRLILRGSLIIVALFTIVASARSQEHEDYSTIDFKWGIRIPLRDGISLSATVYTPKGLKGPVPCVFTLTPYVADTYHERGVYFATHGVPFLTVDARGRGNSEGTFRPNIQEAQDGYDVVEWLAKQSYCDGKVAMWGGSYAGYDQWATAKEFPPHLATIVPAAAPYMGVDVPMRNNVFYPYLMQWMTFTSGHASQTNIFYDAAFWSAIYGELIESGKPFRELDSIAGNPSTSFHEWIEHPEPDSYWDAYNPTAEQYARLQIPILTITGSNDSDQPGALAHYKEYMRNASPAARKRHYLIIGPWDHAGTRTPKMEFSGLKLGPASLVDLPMLHLQWYAWTMQNGPQPDFLKKLVAYYVMGAEKWRYADTLDGVTSRSQSYFLDSTGSATDVFAAGSLGPTVGKGGPDGYTYDPRTVDEREIGAEEQADDASLIDQSVTLAMGGKELVYHSAPFEKDTEVSGFFKLTAWISIDRPDTDIYVSVYEIGRDGTSVRLTTDVIRARYREGLRTPKIIQTRAPLRYDFNRFTFLSRLIKRGDRLRLVIAPVGNVSGEIFNEKNYGGGGVVADESAHNAMPVTVTLYHDRVHPSALYVPYGQID